MKCFGHSDVLSCLANQPCDEMPGCRQVGKFADPAAGQTDSVATTEAQSLGGTHVELNFANVMKCLALQLGSKKALNGGMIEMRTAKICIEIG